MYQKNSADEDLRRLSDPVKAKGIMLAGFLNMAAPASRARIVHIVELLRSAEEFKSSRLPSWRPVAGSDGVTAVTASKWPGFQALHEANHALKRYRPRLLLEVPTRDAPGIRVRAHHETDEDQAAYWLVSLTEAGWLSFLRDCEVCAGWFYANRSDQIQCVGCRRRRYAKTPFYKARARVQSKISYWEGKRKLATTRKARDLAKEKIQAARRELDALKESRA